MSVYVELVIFNNLAIDFLLVVATQTIRRRKLKKLRTFASVVLGATLATCYPLLPEWAQILARILLAPAMTLVLDRYVIDEKRTGRTNGIARKCGESEAGVETKHDKDNRNIKNAFCDYLKSLFVFAFATYFVGGAIYGLSFAMGVDIKSYAVLGLCALALALTILCARVIASKRSKKGCAIKDATVCVNGRKILLKGLCDSGNLLVDDVSGLPVAVLSAKAKDTLGKVSVEGFVNVASVAGEKCMPIVDAECVEVDGKRCACKIAICDNNFGDYDLILQHSMF